MVSREERLRRKEVVYEGRKPGEIREMRSWRMRSGREGARSRKSSTLLVARVGREGIGLTVAVVLVE